MTNIENINENITNQNCFFVTEMENTLKTSNLSNESSADVSNEVLFIDGIFTSDDASEILLTVVDDKIRYHEKLLFRNTLRYGVDTNNSEQRIMELKEELKKIRDLMIEAKAEGKLVEVKSVIEITFKG
jgi:hypothetical protein